MFIGETGKSTYRLTKFSTDNDTQDAVTIQSIRALEQFVSSRGSGPLRDALEAIAAGLRSGATVTIAVEGNC